ncbi:hypothetical protein LVD15_06985 [Fulvivirga maritima]|uniref:hypothetical protein n=1 Tax=Fulvivirga maritima TaxID=2904247 RepID=UPI001F171B87|nr:hypothetical protein [Fulvivirga maritima]UII28162.1 hypothetical protein LVD15_06985 [Fulvivirga maritima]
MKTRTLAIISFLGLIISPLYAQRDAPYDIKSAGDNYEKKCAECNNMITSKAVEVEFGVMAEGNDIYFLCTDAEWFVNLMGSNGDGIAIDIISKKQFRCDSKNHFDKSSMYRGYLLPPLYKKELLASALYSEDSFLKIKVGTIPTTYRNQELEFNILFLQDHYLCYYQWFFNIEGAKWELLDMGLFVDTLQNTNVIDKAISLNKQFKFEIPFEKSKSVYDPADIKPIYDSLQLYDYDIKQLTIEAYTSIEGSREVNEELQQKRANSIASALAELQEHDLNIEIKTAENWVDFFTDIQDTPFRSWENMNKGNIKEQLKNEKVLERLEPILSKHRKAILYMTLEKKATYQFESEEQAISLFNEAVKQENLEAALAIQKAAFYYIQSQSMPESLIDKLEVPQTSFFGPVINNKLVFKRTFAPQNIYYALDEFEKLYQLIPENPRVLYNLVALQLEIFAYSDPTLDENQILGRIKKLSKSSLEKSLVDRLQINYGIIKSDKLNYERRYKEKNDMLRTIYDIYSSHDLSEADALSMAKYFVSFQQYPLAVSIMKPYINQIDTSEDLLFFYINLTIVDPKLINSPSYRSLLINASNKNPERFCQLFNSSLEGGITFQLLSNAKLKDQYCESCSN